MGIKQYSLCLILWAMSASIILAAGREKPADFDRNDLEAVEELSESLANDLLDLSVAGRRKDRSAMARFFDDQLRVTAISGSPGEATESGPWVLSHRWPHDGTLRTVSREQYVEEWAGFLNHFSAIEDVRFKVKYAAFPDANTADADVKFFLVARGCDDRREWVTSTAKIRARRSGGEPARWLLTEVRLEPFDSRLAEAELFEEVSVPAGVAHVSPRYGTPGNEGFLWNGAAAADVDSDGWMDLFVTGQDRNFLYRNLGDGRFEEIAEEVGVAWVPNRVAAALFLDIDNDGDLDLFLSSAGTQMLFENRLREAGALDFVDATDTAGVSATAVGFSAVAADVNGDSLPDIYVASYNRYGEVMPNAWDKATNGTPNRLFINEGNGRFREKASELGVADSRWSYAAAFADFDSDGDQDLYVPNDFGENALYLNEGGHFRDVAEERGVLDPGNGMGAAFGDLDNDGLLDLHVTNMSSTAGNRILQRLYGKSATPDSRVLRKLAAGNSLYRNKGDGTFEFVNPEAHTFASGWAWGGGYFDFDNNGLEDLFTPNGLISGKSMKDT